jgi:hypothetical protein
MNGVVDMPETMLYSIVNDNPIKEAELMHKQQQTKAKRRVWTLQKQMGSLGPFMRGTVVVIGTRNKQPYFSLNKDKKTKLIYLGKKRENQARRMSAAYKKLLDIIEEMTILNMHLLKNDALS